MSALLFCAVVVHALWAASKPVTSDDLWWGMAAGRYIVEHGTVPDRDVLSYTHAGVPWINGEWLSQVIEFELYRHTAGLGIAVFKLAVVLVVFFIVAWMSWRRTGSPVITAGVMGLCAYICRPYFDLRSQLFLFLCTTLALAVIEAYRAGARSWVLALLPPIMVLWVNTHYSFLFGTGLLFLCAGAELAKTWLRLPRAPMPWDRARRLAAGAGGAVLAALLNPFGFEAFTHPLSILGSDTAWRRYIIEWVPPALFTHEDFNPAIFGYALVGQLAVTAAACAWMRRRVDVTDGLLFASTLMMALSARRFVPIFALVGAPFVARCMVLLRDHFLRPWIRALEGATPTGMVAVALLAVVATAAAVVDAAPVVRMVRARGIFDVLVGGDYFPAGAAELLQKNPLPGRLFHAYTWGGFLSFHLPHQTIFIDGRAHTVYPLDFYRQYLLAENGLPGWQDLLERWQVALIVWPENPAHGTRDTAALEQFRGAVDWVHIYSDGQASVFAHGERGRPWVDAFKQTTLVYPDVGDAPLFAAISYWNANKFEAARRYFETAMRRLPEATASSQDAERLFLQPAQTANSARAWFNVGFFRELNGDRKGAAQAFSRALEIGLGEPDATAYAMAALERLPFDG